MAKAHMLYRFYDADDVLLYVGITMNPSQRWANHREEKAWWSDVATVRTQLFDSREAVAEAEIEAIRHERPLHNVVHNAPPKPTQQRPPKPTTIVWRCDICDEPVRAGDGYIEVDMREVARYERAWDEYQERQKAERAEFFGAVGTTVDFLVGDYPRQARWHVYHRACDPEPDYSGYWFDIGTADTHRKMVDWAAHMFHKVWINATEWDVLLYRANGGPL